MDSLFLLLSHLRKELHQQMSTSAANAEVFDFDIVIARGSLRVTEDRQTLDRLDEHYAPLREAATVVFSHLRRSGHAKLRLHSMVYQIFRDCPLSQAAFTTRWENDLGPTMEMVTDYLANHLPTLVLASRTELQAQLQKKQIVWGLVTKEDSNFGDANEIFLPQDLAELIVPRASASHLAKIQRLIWSISLKHEVVHALTDYVFPRLSTPLLAGLGEAGHAFELLQFGFILEVEIEKKWAKTLERMTKIVRLLGRTKSKTFEIDETTVDLLLSSLESDRLYQVNVPAQGKYTNPSHQSYERFRIGEYSTDEAEDDVVVAESDNDGPSFRSHDEQDISTFGDRYPYSVKVMSICLQVLCFYAMIIPLVEFACTTLDFTSHPFCRDEGWPAFHRIYKFNPGEKVGDNGHSRQPLRDFVSSVLTLPDKPLVDEVPCRSVNAGSNNFCLFW
ncbi:hypothetical protein B0H16DRAFT_1846738 [Mycena metata]|uniref:Uncharacterized protein n=1 Tax=Mycena metata TaxID=1033252 RepID=A0AAD7NWV1_9AGAR|nr:hypothetical protein B0H16DRAFT_1846738 [Mycena metata]